MEMSISQPGDSWRRRRIGGPLGWGLALLSSVWFGIVCAALLFIYCSIGSALPTVRQQPLLEMTEFEWFHWWPFNVLIVVFCLTMIVVTLRRIPLRTVNAGVWMIHGGIVTLTLGSYYYFATKVEGDAPVFRRQVSIALPELAEPRALLALPGNAVDIDVGGHRWQFAVQSTNSAWPILSEEHQGESAFAVNVRVLPPGGEPFVRQLLAGFPQYTEDILPGRGRAIKELGQKLVRDDLTLSLDYHPTASFHVRDTWALFVRNVGAAQWHERPLDGLPRYYDRLNSREHVFTDPGQSVPLRPIDLPVPEVDNDDPLAGAPIHVTGYLRYAFLERRWFEGGHQINPVIQVRVRSGSASDDRHELIAFDPARSSALDGNLQFLWVGNASQVQTLPADSRAMLHVEVPAAKVSSDIPITPELLASAMQPIEGTEFSFRITSVQDRLAIPGLQSPVSIAMVEIQTPEGRIRRWVADRPEVTRDFHGESTDPHAGAPVEPDARIQMRYQPASAPLMFVAYPSGLHFVFNSSEGRAMEKPVKIGEEISVLPGLSLLVDAYWERAAAQVKPFVVPMASRQRDAGETFSMIRVEVGAGPGVQSRWLQFNRYAFPGPEYAPQGSRFGYAPERFRLADGREVELLFSRRRVPLPNPIALEDFALDTHLGGYTGQSLTIRNYISRLRFFDGGQWSPPVAVAVNSPTEFGGYWYFQSEWDAPVTGNPTGGAKHTGLGIGNRNGVHVQLLGCCMVVAGMIFAFYIKPVLQRRRRQRAVSSVSTVEQGDALESLGPVLEPGLAR